MTDREPPARLGQRSDAVLDAARLAGAWTIGSPPTKPRLTRPSLGSAACRPPRLRPPPRESDARCQRQARHGQHDKHLLQEHIVSPAPTHRAPQSIQRMVADQLGDALPPDFSANVLAVHPGAGRRALSDLRRLVHRRRAWTRPIGCASTSRSSRARSPGEAAPGPVHRGPLQMASASFAVRPPMHHGRWAGRCWRCSSL